jgi:hypothetical protein
MFNFLGFLTTSSAAFFTLGISFARSEHKGETSLEQNHQKKLKGRTHLLMQIFDSLEKLCLQDGIFWLLRESVRSLNDLIGLVKHCFGPRFQRSPV